VTTTAQGRPSIHKPFTKSYAIDQIDDMEYLRVVTHRMWEAFFAAHSQAAHAIAALLGNGCKQCCVGEDGEPCGAWKAWQAKVNDGFGTV
jgi:hypothetical protein